MYYICIMENKLIIALLTQTLKRPEFSLIQKTEKFQKKVEELIKTIGDKDEIVWKHLNDIIAFMKSPSITGEDREWNKFLNAFWRALEGRRKGITFDRGDHIKSKIDKHRQRYGG